MASSIQTLVRGAFAAIALAAAGTAVQARDKVTFLTPPYGNTVVPTQKFAKDKPDVERASSRPRWKAGRATSRTRRRATR